MVRKHWKPHFWRTNSTPPKRTAALVGVSSMWVAAVLGAFTFFIFVLHGMHPVVVVPAAGVSPIGQSVQPQGHLP
eukprot:3566431-Amphidinium_carterae.1